MGKECTSSLTISIVIALLPLLVAGCLIADPAFTPNDKEAVLRSEKHIVIKPVTTPKAGSVKNK